MPFCLGYLRVSQEVLYPTLPWCTSLPAVNVPPAAGNSSSKTLADSRSTICFCWKTLLSVLAFAAIFPYRLCLFHPSFRQPASWTLRCPCQSVKLLCSCSLSSYCSFISCNSYLPAGDPASRAAIHSCSCHMSAECWRWVASNRCRPDTCMITRPAFYSWQDYLPMFKFLWVQSCRYWQFLLPTNLFFLFRQSTFPWKANWCTLDTDRGRALWQSDPSDSSSIHRMLQSNY